MANNHGAQRRAQDEPSAAEQQAASTKVAAQAPAPKATRSKTPASKPPVIDGASDGSIGGPPPKVTNFEAPTVALYVGPNRSVTSPRGQLNSGDEVRVTDFDAETLERLLDKHVVLRGAPKG